MLRKHMKPGRGQTPNMTLTIMQKPHLNKAAVDMWLMMISRTHPPAKHRISASTAAGLTVSVYAGLHHELQAQHLPVHLAALGPDARLLHRLRHCHAEDVPVGSSPVPSSVPHCLCKILFQNFANCLLTFG